MRSQLLALTLSVCVALSAHAQTGRVPTGPKTQPTQPKVQPNLQIQNRVQPIPIQTPPNTNLPTLQQQQQQLLLQQQQILMQQQLLQQQLLQQQQQQQQGNMFERGVLGSGENRMHRVFLQAGVTYSIDLGSNDFDAFLELQKNNRTIRQNDDGGQGLNSRIVFQPTQSGNYQIVVRAVDDTPGNYVLSVRRQ